MKWAFALIVAAALSAWWVDGARSEKSRAAFGSFAMTMTEVEPDSAAACSGASINPSRFQHFAVQDRDIFWSVQDELVCEFVGDRMMRAFAAVAPSQATHRIVAGTNASGSYWRLEPFSDS